MIDIIRFEENGKTYAKGFVNQEGRTFYVLSGYEGKFSAAAEEIFHTVSDRALIIETTNVLPGEQAGVL